MVENTIDEKILVVESVKPETIPVELEDPILKIHPKSDDNLYSLKIFGDVFRPISWLDGPEE